MKCSFCDFSSDEMKKRIFYRDEDWFAILAAPGHNKGHALLTVVRKTSNCPTEPSLEVFSGLPKALWKAIQAVKTVYQPKNVLLSSLRGSESHFHLVPLHEDEEKGWRNLQKDKEGYRNGHLMEFLGYLEKQGDERAKEERRKSGFSEEQQRTKIIASQKPEIEKLRLAAGYYSR